MGPLARQPSHGRPAPRLPDGVARVVPGSAMLAFSLLLLVITGLLVTASGFAVSPMDGARSLLPLSLIIIATVCMHVDAASLDDHVVSPRAVVAGHQPLRHLGRRSRLHRGRGAARRGLPQDLKAGGRRNIFRALRLTRVEMILATALFTAAGALAVSGHKPWLLIAIIVLQGCVYLCGPVASVWNLWARGVPVQEYRRRFEQRRLRAERRRPLARLPARPRQPSALCAGGVTSAFLPAAPLLHATATPRPVEAAKATPGGTEAYLQLGPAGGGYYPITSVQLSTTSGQVGLQLRHVLAHAAGQGAARERARRADPHVRLTVITPGLKPAWQPRSWTRSLRPSSPRSRNTCPAHQRGVFPSPAPGRGTWSLRGTGRGGIPRLPPPPALRLCRPRPLTCASAQAPGPRPAPMP